MMSNVPADEPCNERWMHVFRIGLNGILASVYCKRVVMTDYHDKVVDLLQRNIQLNSHRTATPFFFLSACHPSACRPLTTPSAARSGHRHAGGQADMGRGRGRVQPAVRPVRHHHRLRLRVRIHCPTLSLSSSSHGVACVVCPPLTAAVSPGGVPARYESECIPLLLATAHYLLPVNDTDYNEDDLSKNEGGRLVLSTNNYRYERRKEQFEGITQKLGLRQQFMDMRKLLAFAEQEKAKDPRVAVQKDEFDLIHVCTLSRPSTAVPPTIGSSAPSS